MPCEWTYDEFGTKLCNVVKHPVTCSWLASFGSDDHNDLSRRYIEIVEELGTGLRPSDSAPPRAFPAGHPLRMDVLGHGVYAPALAGMSRQGPDTRPGRSGAMSLVVDCHMHVIAGENGSLWSWRRERRSTGGAKYAGATRRPIPITSSPCGCRGARPGRHEDDCPHGRGGCGHQLHDAHG